MGAIGRTVLACSALLFAGQAKAGQMLSLIGNDVPCRDKFLSGQITADCVPQYIAYVIQQVFALTGAICLIVIMIGGFQYALGTVAGGKDKAMATIRYGIIGMIVSALAFFILDFVISAIAGS